ncbi:unnamed protein product [Oikopleura dioica]|uniref:Uncharacterized protein n=1 Tax=Oikopleura dioica TaxID=34765 RepID=E4XMM3_OIKDI|nr:unnamed protein product [Oikopleura dioica]
MMSKAEYEEQGVIETNKAMEELRKIIENSQNPVKTFMKFGGETRAKLLDFINSGEHLSVEVNKNIPESQHFVEECEKFDQTSPLKRKIDKLKKGQIYESPKRYPSFIHPSYILTGQAALKRR